VYFAFAAIYIVLSVVFIADVLRQPSTAVHVFAWIVYGIWRMRQTRGL
jgi:hypothetical protein